MASTIVLLPVTIKEVGLRCGTKVAAADITAMLNTIRMVSLVAPNSENKRVITKQNNVIRTDSRTKGFRFKVDAPSVL